MKVIFHDDFYRVYTSDPAASDGRMESIVEVITPHVDYIEAQPAAENQIAFVHESAHIEYVRILSVFQRALTITGMTGAACSEPKTIMTSENWCAKRH
jgi:hypothetical protein